VLLSGIPGAKRRAHPFALVDEVEFVKTNSYIALLDEVIRDSYHRRHAPTEVLAPE
jgi:hypothetical protein